MPCPACKIIIDGGRLASAAEWLSDFTDGAVSKAARYLASIVRANTDALIHGIKAGKIVGPDVDEAHAWSELQCHRAARIEEQISPGNTSKPNPTISETMLYVWARQDRERATKLVGGEYSGAWTVDGTEGITPKE